MSRPKAEPVIRIDDERFRATEWRFAPGAETGWHRHDHDYVVVPLADGTLRLEESGGGSREAPLKRHLPYSRPLGVEHNVINAGDAPLAFLEVEAVGGVLAAGRHAVMERFAAAWNARDLDALMACMAEACAFHAAAGQGASGAVHQGREAVRAAYGAIFETFPEARWTDPRHSISGDVGLPRWRFVGIDRAGAPVEVDGCDVLTFEEGGTLIALKDTYRKARS